MTTTSVFPAALDSCTNPTAADKRDGSGPGGPATVHHVQHSHVNDVALAVQKKVGIDGSTDPATLDYRVAALEAGGGGGGGDWYGAASGTNSYAAATGSTALATGDVYVIRFANANTGASTLNADSLGAVVIQQDGAALTGGEIASGETLMLVYDGTNFQIIGPHGGAGAATSFWRDKTGGAWGLVAVGGEDTITFAAAPIVHSVRMFVNGTELQPSDYVISTATEYLLFSALSAGDVIDISYATNGTAATTVLSSGGITYAVWDAAHCHASETLSSASTVATDNSAGNWNGVLATAPNNSGQFFVCGKILAVSSGGGSGYGPAFGLAVPSTTTIYNSGTFHYLGQDGDCFGYHTVRASGTPISAYGGTITNLSLPNGVVNDVPMIAVDFAAGKIWFGLNGTWNGTGDPATGANPDLTFTSGTTFVVAATNYFGSSLKLLTDPSSIPYSPPAGFTKGWY